MSSTKLTQAFTGAVTTDYSYDLRGNLTSKDEGPNLTTYEWTGTHNDKLAQVVLTQNSIPPVVTTVAYTYDGDGNRIEMTDALGTIHYLNDPAGMSQVLQEEDGSGTLLSTYTYGLDLISQERGGVFSYYHYDGLGSVRQLTDAAKAVTDTYTYEAFGGVVASTGGTENGRQFTGEEHDSSVGLQYLRARYYDPSIGRFISKDPRVSPGYYAKYYAKIKLGEGPRLPLRLLLMNPQNLNPYVYANNNPVNLIDPTGGCAYKVWNEGHYNKQGEWVEDPIPWDDEDPPPEEEESPPC